MNRKYARTILCIGAVIYFAFTSGIALGAAGKATISELNGNVLYRASDASEWKKAAVGMTLSADATMRTGPDSTAVLTMGGDMVKARPLTEMKIGQLDEDSVTGRRQAEISVANGSVFARARKMGVKDSTFTIKTPSAIAGVRGTEFSVTLNELKAAVIAVLSGEVNVAAAGVEIVVTDAMQTMIEPGAVPSQPIVIPHEMMLELKKDLVELDKIEKEAEKQAAETAGEQKKEAKEEVKAEKKEATKEEAKEEKKEASSTSSAAASEEEEVKEETSESSEQSAAEGVEQEEQPAETAEIQNITDVTTEQSVNEQLNNDIANQEEIFEGCCKSR